METVVLTVGLTAAIRGTHGPASLSSKRARRIPSEKFPHDGLYYWQ